jgi:osmotically inducible protein OsmC
MDRKASAIWNGDLKTGKGTITTQSKTLDAAQYSFKSRFEEGTGTNPEELIAAAHAGCFTMAFANELATAGFVAVSVETEATVTLNPAAEGGPAVTKIHLVNKSAVPGIEKAQFDEIAAKAKAGCPISKLLKAAEITLDATLAS